MNIYTVYIKKNDKKLKLVISTSLTPDRKEIMRKMLLKDLTTSFNLLGEISIIKIIRSKSRNIQYGSFSCHKGIKILSSKSY